MGADTTLDTVLDAVCELDEDGSTTVKILSFFLLFFISIYFFPGKSRYGRDLNT